MPIEVELLDSTGDVMGRSPAKKVSKAYLNAHQWIYSAEVLIMQGGTIDLCVIYDEALPGGYAATQCPMHDGADVFTPYGPPVMRQGDNFTFTCTINFVRDDYA